MIVRIVLVWNLISGSTSGFLNGPNALLLTESKEFGHNEGVIGPKIVGVIEQGGCGTSMFRAPSAESCRSEVLLL